MSLSKKHQFLLTWTGSPQPDNDTVMLQTAPLLLCAVAVIAVLAGVESHRWLWRNLPRLSRFPTPGVRSDLCAGGITAILVIAFVAVEGLGWLGIAHCAFSVFAVQLSVIDWRLRILPNALLLPFGLMSGALLFASAASVQGWSDYGRALLGSGLLFLAYLIMATLSPSGLGMGDVKLAAVVGLFLAYQGWDTLFFGAAAGFIAGAIIGLSLLVVRSAKLKSLVPFGPSMLGGATVALLFSALR